MVKAKLLLLLGMVVPSIFAGQSPTNGGQLKNLPPGVVAALATDEKAYCDQFLGDFKRDCKQNFRANVLWRQLVIGLTGQGAILVESHNMGQCGSAGCSLYLFVQQPNAKFVQVL